MPCLSYTDIRSFFASENDMNALIRGVRFAMRIGRAQCAKGVFEPRADSTDTKDFFYMGDADPDRVCTNQSPFIADADLSATACCCCRSQTRRSRNTSSVTVTQHSTP